MIRKKELNLYFQN